MDNKNYCWFCNKEIKEDDYFVITYEFDAFICLKCFDKLQNKPNFRNDLEANIIREELGIKVKY